MSPFFISIKCHNVICFTIQCFVVVSTLTKCFEIHHVIFAVMMLIFFNHILTCTLFRSRLYTITDMKTVQQNLYVDRTLYESLIC